MKKVGQLAAEGHPAQPPPDAAGQDGGAALLAADPYPSLYHPPPFRANAAEEISLVT